MIIRLFHSLALSIFLLGSLSVYGIDEIKDGPTPLFKLRYTNPRSGKPSELYLLGTQHSLDLKYLPPVAEDKVRELAAAKDTFAFIEAQDIPGEVSTEQTLAALRMDSIAPTLLKAGVSKKEIGRWKEFYAQKIIPSLTKSYAQFAETATQDDIYEVEDLKNFLLTNTLHPTACLHATQLGLSWHGLIEDGMDSQISMLFHGKSMGLETEQESILSQFSQESLTSKEGFERSCEVLTQTWETMPSPPKHAKALARHLYCTLWGSPLISFSLPEESPEGLKAFCGYSLEKRNASWISRICSSLTEDTAAASHGIHGTSRALVVCGFGHLIGERGLLKGLQAQLGGEITQIYDRHTKRIKEITTIKNGEVVISPKVISERHDLVERRLCVKGNDPYGDFASQFNWLKFLQNAERMQQELPPLEGLILKLPA